MSGLGERIRVAFEARRPGRATLPSDRNFFEAGYTSVLLAAVVGELAEDGVRLSLVDVFRYPTLAALTEELQARAAGGPAAPAAMLPWQA
ncbi:acyl carrier protein [Cryptosporangium sp. NPDC051539]|uniref:acyl carrier protein n=1 Tax=Cryptosporangium sp. NPDC051539 TaxID=3363962 RepID=UPI0037AE4A16